jgi:SAM-dependent methyltransferase
MNLKETYNKIAADWYKDHKSDDWWVEGTEAFSRLLPPGGDVLDVGCGAGVKSKYLTAKGFKVVGLDFSEKLIEIAKKTVPGANFTVMDLNNVDDLGKKFDAVFAQAVLLHFKKTEVTSTLDKIVSILKGGGYLYIAVKSKVPGMEDESVLKENDYGYEYERFFSYYSMDELKGYIRNMDMEVVYENSKLFGKTTWLQIIGKKK